MYIHNVVLTIMVICQCYNFYSSLRKYYFKYCTFSPSFCWIKRKMLFQTSIVVVLNLGAIFPIRGHLAMSGDIFYCDSWGERMLLTSTWYMLTILWCIGQSLSTKNWPAQNVISVALKDASSFRIKMGLDASHFQQWRAMIAVRLGKF